MRQEFYYPSSDGETQIHAIEWAPEGEVRAVLQICHGMVEYIGRYDAFASWLAKRGFYVTGNDHLGHGKSVTSVMESPLHLTASTDISMNRTATGA